VGHSSPKVRKEVAGTHRIRPRQPAIGHTLKRGIRTGTDLLDEGSRIFAADKTSAPTCDRPRRGLVFTCPPRPLVHTRASPGPGCRFPVPDLPGPVAGRRSNLPLRDVRRSGPCADTDSIGPRPRRRPPQPSGRRGLAAGRRHSRSSNTVRPDWSPTNALARFPRVVGRHQTLGIGRTVRGPNRGRGRSPNDPVPSTRWFSAPFWNADGRPDVHPGDAAGMAVKLTGACRRYDVRGPDSSTGTHRIIPLKRVPAPDSGHTAAGLANPSRFSFPAPHPARPRARARFLSVPPPPRSP